MKYWDGQGLRLVFPSPDLHILPAYSHSAIPVTHQWSQTNQLFLRVHRKQQKRSHTLRYVLKDRNKPDEVLFVVLFTLYLKDDVVDGVVKDGVEGGKPLALMSEKDREKHEQAKNGEIEVELKENQKLDGAGDGAVETNDDDVD